MDVRMISYLQLLLTLRSSQTVTPPLRCWPTDGRTETHRGGPGAPCPYPPLGEAAVSPGRTHNHTDPDVAPSEPSPRRADSSLLRSEARCRRLDETVSWRSPFWPRPIPNQLPPTPAFLREQWPEKAFSLNLSWTSFKVMFRSDLHPDGTPNGGFRVSPSREPEVASLWIGTRPPSSADLLSCVDAHRS